MHPIRSATPADSAVLREVERRAGLRFRDVGLPEVADDEPPASALLASYAEVGRSWVVVGADDVAVGYVLVDVVDGAAHIAQLSVDPGHQGIGLGRRLVEQVASWAVHSGHRAVTLTTFVDVPWNAPLYAHLGFRVLGLEELGPGLRARRQAEAVAGLDPARRVCMRRDVTAGP